MNDKQQIVIWKEYLLIDLILHIISKSRFIKGDGNCINILIDTNITPHKNIHWATEMTPIDAWDHFEEADINTTWKQPSTLNKIKNAK